MSLTDDINVPDPAVPVEAVDSSGGEIVEAVESQPDYAI